MEELRDEIDRALLQAQGEVASRLRDAEAEANSTREQIEEEYQDFSQWLQQYRAYPEQTLIKLWTRMQSEILGSKQNEVFWVPETNVVEVLVNRDPQKAVEAERARLLKQIQQAP